MSNNEHNLSIAEITPFTFCRHNRCGACLTRIRFADKPGVCGENFDLRVDFKATRKLWRTIETLNTHGYHARPLRGWAYTLDFEGDHTFFGRVGTLFQTSEAQDLLWVYTSPDQNLLGDPTRGMLYRMHEDAIGNIARQDYYGLYWQTFQDSWHDRVAL